MLNFAIHTPELALVRFVVEDHDKASRNDFVGQFTIPFASIQTGRDEVVFDSSVVKMHALEDDDDAVEQ